MKPRAPLLCSIGRRPVFWLLMSGPPAVLLGLCLGGLFLPLIQSAFAYPVFLLSVRRGQWRRCVVLMALWACLTGAAVGAISYHRPETAAERVLGGVVCQQEMFQWISTGFGDIGLKWWWAPVWREWLRALTTL
jgi:hypothetical protein